MRRILFILALAVLAVVLLACANQNAPGVSDAATQSGNAVSVKDNAFSPVNLQAPAGTVVKFVNNDSVAHRLVADDGSFDSGTLDEGKVFRFTFPTSGTYRYRCSLHPYSSETGSVVIK